MGIEAISGAATVATTCTVVFVAAAWSWQLVSRLVASQPSFRESIMREAAQRFRDELDRLSAAQSIWLGAGVVFTVMFLSAYHLRAQELFRGYPVWQLKLLLAVLGLAAAFVGYRLVRTVAALRRIRFVRDANIAVGHLLQKIASGHARVFHDVPTSAGVVDHVVVGQSGIYAVNVVARRRFGEGSVRLTGNELEFLPGGNSLSIVDIAAKSARLEKELKKQHAARLRVRSVIAVPGWDVESQSNESHLLVNERNLPMFRGWKERADYLMNEDVDALQEILSARCSRGRARAA